MFMRYWVKDHYQTLGISSSATHDEVRRAYKQLALKYHPDKLSPLEDPGQVLFKAINEAHSILSDPEKRKKYDIGYKRYRSYLSKPESTRVVPSTPSVPKPTQVTCKSDVDVELEIITPSNDHIVSCKEGIYIFSERGDIKDTIYASTDQYRKRPKAMTAFPNGNIATVCDASLGDINEVKFEIFNIHTKERRQFYGRDITLHYYVILIALDNERLAILNEYGNKIAVYSISMGTQEAEYQIDDYYKGTSSATLLSNGMLAIASRESSGTIFIYNLEQSKVESKFDRRDHRSFNPADAVLAMADLGDNLLALYDSKQKISVYEITNGLLISSVDAKDVKITTPSQLLDVFAQYGLCKTQEQNNTNVTSSAIFRI